MVKPTREIYELGDDVPMMPEVEDPLFAKLQNTVRLALKMIGEAIDVSPLIPAADKQGIIDERREVVLLDSETVWDMRQNIRPDAYQAFQERNRTLRDDSF